MSTLSKKTYERSQFLNLKNRPETTNKKIMNPLKRPNLPTKVKKNEFCERFKEDSQHKAFLSFCQTSLQLNVY